MKLKNMTLDNIAIACNGTYVGDAALKSEQITGVEKDSRLIEEGFCTYLLPEQEWTVMILFLRSLRKALYVH